MFTFRFTFDSQPLGCLSELFMFVSLGSLVSFRRETHIGPDDAKQSALLQVQTDYDCGAVFWVFTTGTPRCLADAPKLFLVPRLHHCNPASRRALVGRPKGSFGSDLEEDSTDKRTPKKRHAHVSMYRSLSLALSLYRAWKGRRAPTFPYAHPRVLAGFSKLLPVVFPGRLGFTVPLEEIPHCSKTKYTSNAE